MRFATLKLYFFLLIGCNKAAFLCMGIDQNLDFGVFVCNVVWIGQNLQNEEPVERTTCILAECDTLYLPTYI